MRFDAFLLSMFFILAACSSTKELQHKLCDNRVGLGYELETEPYAGPRARTVVMKEVGASNMNHRTWVKQHKMVLVPLLLFNYRKAMFDVELGEQSLYTPYRDFFLNALYAESDHSGRFRLQSELPEVMNDSVYILEIYFDSIATRGQIKYLESVVLWFDEDLNFGQGTLENFNYSLKNVASRIGAHIALYKGAQCVLRKSYDISLPLSCRLRRSDLSSFSFYSMQELGNALSCTTRALVETIVQELNMLLQ